ncbi:MAG: RHS repeat protein [Caldilineae bacterium]|nr:MAG: RHS repeat protein [Caldilineae bacterium]
MPAFVHRRRFLMHGRPPRPFGFLTVFALLTFLLVGLLLLCLPIRAQVDPGVDIQTLELTPSDDTYVSIWFPNQPTGNEHTFWVIYGESYALLKFPLSELPPNAEILSATLTLRLYQYSLLGGKTGQVLLLQDDSWTENTVTWHTRPQTDPNSPVAETTFSHYRPGATDTWDITELVRYALSEGTPEIAAQQTITETILPLQVQVKESGSPDSQEWYSKESGATYAPKLQITYRTAPPTPSPTHRFGGQVLGPGVIPMQGVNVKLFGRKEGDSSWTQLQQATTNSDGRFSFSVWDSAYDYYRIVVDPPPGWTSSGAIADRGTVIDYDTIEYHHPEPGTYTGNMFYLTRATPTPTLTPTATPTPTPPSEHGAIGRNSHHGKSVNGGDPIAMSNGAYHFTMPLLDLGGPMGLHFSLLYRSDLDRIFDTSPADFPYGFWWSPKYIAALSDELGEDIWTVQMANGDTAAFKKRNGEWVLVGPEDNFGIPDNGSSVRYHLKETAAYLYFMDPETNQVVIFEKVPTSGPLKMVARVVRVLDRNGNQLVYTYATSNDTSPKRIEDGLGRSLDFTYDSEGLVRVTDQAGRQVSFSFDHGADNGGALTLRSITDPMGQTTTLHYQMVGFTGNNIASIQRPLGNIPYTQTYGSVVMSGTVAARVIEQRDAYGNTTTFAYDPNQNRVTITWPDDTTTVYQHYSYRGLPKSITDATGHTITFTKNITEQITSVTNRLGDTTTYTYDPESGQVATITNNLGQVTTITYAPQTYTFTNPISPTEIITFTFYDLSRVEYPDGAYQAFTYDTHGNVIAYTNNAGHTWQVTYNERGQPLTILNPAGGVITYTYNADGTLASRADSDLGAATCSYDQYKRLTRITYPDGTSVQFTYDLNDHITSLTDENGQTYTFEYDANGRLVRVTDPLGHSSQYRYDVTDRLVQETNRLGSTTTYTYDALGRLASTRDATGVTTRFGYDSVGRLSQASIGDMVWTYDHDLEGVLTAITMPSGRTTRYQVDRMGRLVGVVDPLNRRATLDRDVRGRVTRVTDPLNRSEELTYDEIGELAGVILPLVGATMYDRNPLNQVTQIKEPNGNSWRFTYSRMGRLLTHTDPLGRTWRYTYDNVRGRLAQITYPDDNTLTISYDAAGNATRLHYSEGPDLRFTYDALGRLVGADHLQLELDAEGNVTNTRDGDVTFGATYDHGERLKTVSYNGVFTVTYTYDQATGLLVKVQDSLTGAQVHLTYDADARLVGIARSNGVTTTITWDDGDRIVRLQDGNFMDLRYSLDAAGQVTRAQMVTPLDPTIGLEAQVTELTYDDAGQISSAGYLYDQRGRLIAAPGHTYTWDGASRLVAVNGVTLGYNGRGDIITRTEGGMTTHYYHNYAIDMAPIVAERDETTGQFLRYYVWTPEGELLYMIDATQGHKVYFYHFDRIGSTLALTDEAGVVTDAYAYDPFGRLLAHQGDNLQPFTFVGRWGVRQEGRDGTLYHMRARYYDAVTQHFLSRDPVWPQLLDPLQINPYQYAVNSPVSAIDPMGTFITSFLGKYIVRPLLFPGRQEGPGRGPGPIMSTASTLWKLSYFTGESRFARITRITPVLRNAVRPVWQRYFGSAIRVQTIGTNRFITLLPKNLGRAARFMNTLSKIARGATLVGGALSWYEIIHFSFFATPSERSRMAAEYRRSWDPFTLVSAWLGQKIGDWWYAEEEKRLRTPRKEQGSIELTEEQKHKVMQTIEAPLMPFEHQFMIAPP